MAQVIVNVCDIHQNEKDEQRQADVTYTFAPEGEKPKALDLCGDCLDMSLTDFVTRVREYGRPVEGASALPKKKGEGGPFGVIPCPFGCTPPRGADGFRSMQGLKMHMSMAKNQGIHQSYDEWIETQK